MDIDIASYKNLYLTKARENLSGIVLGITELEANPSDSASIESIFIKSHSLKGQSMTMGYTGIAKASLVIERYMRGCKDDQKPVDPVVLPVMKEACVKIEQSLLVVEEKNTELPMSDTITKLEQGLGVKI